jgi:hypothetical protein
LLLDVFGLYFFLPGRLDALLDLDATLFDLPVVLRVSLA